MKKREPLKTGRQEAGIEHFLSLFQLFFPSSDSQSVKSQADTIRTHSHSAINSSADVFDGISFQDSSPVRRCCCQPHDINVSSLLLFLVFCCCFPVARVFLVWYSLLIPDIHMLMQACNVLHEPGGEGGGRGEGTTPSAWGKNNAWDWTLLQHQTLSCSAICILFQFWKIPKADKETGNSNNNNNHLSAGTTGSQSDSSKLSRRRSFCVHFRPDFQSDDDDSVWESECNALFHE